MIMAGHRYIFSVVPNIEENPNRKKQQLCLGLSVSDSLWEMPVVILLHKNKSSVILSVLFLFVCIKLVAFPVRF